MPPRSAALSQRGGHCHNRGGLSTVPAACWGWPGLPEHPREELGSVASGGVCLFCPSP